MRWSYKTVHYTLKKEGLLGNTFLDESEIEMSLNEYGKGGWELVSMLESLEGVTAVFKQPLETADSFIPKAFAKPVARSAQNVIKEKVQESAQPIAQRNAQQTMGSRTPSAGQITDKTIANLDEGDVNNTSAAHLDSLFDNEEVAEAIFEIVNENDMDELMCKEELPPQTEENKMRSRVKRNGIYGRRSNSTNSDIGAIRIQ